MKKIFIALLGIFAFTAASAQKPIEIDIWPDGLPNTNGRDLTEPYDDETTNYKPTMYVYLPEKSKATGQAILACPGGGYAFVSMRGEGHNWGKICNEKGIALIVVKYRLPFGHTSEVPSTDVYEAMRITRRHAKEWNIDPQKVGVMGFSAGGHLAATVATHATPEARPNFQILVYSVISMRPDMRQPHSDTKPNLIGLDAADYLVDFYSNDEHVNPLTPPALLITVDDDQDVPTRNSTNYYMALKRAGVPAALHIYPHGGHGFGSSTEFPFHKSMLNNMFSWLETLK